MFPELSSAQAKESKHELKIDSVESKVIKAEPELESAKRQLNSILSAIKVKDFAQLHNIARFKPLCMRTLPNWRRTVIEAAINQGDESVVQLLTRLIFFDSNEMTDAVKFAHETGQKKIAAYLQKRLDNHCNIIENPFQDPHLRTLQSHAFFEFI